VRPLAGKRPGARRVAAALFGLGGDVLTRGARAVTGRGADAQIEPPPSAAGEAPPDTTGAAGEAARLAGEAGEAARVAATADEAARVAAAEEAAARLDAARERLRATIAPPDDDAAPSDAPPG
jgi:hypothetical protein